MWVEGVGWLILRPLPFGGVMAAYWWVPALVAHWRNSPKYSIVSVSECHCHCGGWTAGRESLRWIPCVYVCAAAYFWFYPKSWTFWIGWTLVNGSTVRCNVFPNKYDVLIDHNERSAVGLWFVNLIFTETCSVLDEILESMNCFFGLKWLRILCLRNMGTS